MSLTRESPTPARPEVCTDGIDNTCDALIDCAQSSCAGQLCDANGRRCVGTACSCLLGDGGVAPATESSCSDGLDNDCDGLVDCADSNCANVACAANRTCQQSVCTCLSADGGVPQTCASSSLCSCNDEDDQCDSAHGGRCGVRACYYP